MLTVKWGCICPYDSGVTLPAPAGWIISSMGREIGHFFNWKRGSDPSDGWLEIDGREPVSSMVYRKIFGESKAQS